MIGVAPFDAGLAAFRANLRRSMIIIIVIMIGQPLAGFRRSGRIGDKPLASGSRQRVEMFHSRVSFN